MLHLRLRRPVHALRQPLHPCQHRYQRRYQPGAQATGSRFRPQLEILEERTVPSWFTPASLPAPQTELAATLAPDGRIFALGGTDSTQQPLATAEAYVTTTNSWITIPFMPQATTAPAAATGSDGRVYVIGGSSPTGLSSLVQAFSPATNTWRLAANLPTPRSELAAAAGPDGRIYAIGGMDVFGASSVVEAYTPATNTWVSVARMPTPRSWLAAVTGPDGRIYAIGGLDANGNPLSTVQAYTPATNTWTTVESMPTPRSRLAAALGADGRIYAVGGEDASGNPLATAEAYSVAANGWIVVVPMPTARFGLAAAPAPDQRVYAIGGSDASGPLSTVEALTTPPDPRNPAFVSQVYLDLLHRQADAGGFANFVHLLNASLLTPAQMVLAIESSVEYRTDQINAIYETLLHRTADPGGLNALLGFLAAGGTYEQIEAFVAGSNEFFIDSGGTNDAFLNALYQDALGRTPDPGGRAAFDQFLAASGSRTQAAAIIFTSIEHDIDLVAGWYLSFLRRPPDANGLNGFVAALLHGARDETMIAAIVGSDEYFARL